MSTMHTRDAADVDMWLIAASTFDEEGVLVRAVGKAAIVDNGATATVQYVVRAQISHAQMLDLLEETR